MTRTTEKGAAPAGPPRWVTVFALVALALVVLVVVLLIAGRGGGHGPGRHARAGDAGIPAATVAGDRARPAGTQTSLRG